MVVREHAAVDAGRGDGADVGRVHLVVDALRLGAVLLREGRLEIDDASVGLSALQLGERISPNVVE